MGAHLSALFRHDPRKPDANDRNWISADPKISTSPGNRTYILSAINSKLGSDKFSDYKRKINPACLGGHMIDPVTNLEKSTSEDEKQYYERVVKTRVNNIKQQVIERLDKLVS